MFVTILIFMACGAVAGVLAGLLGVGGGIVIVPMLDVVFTQLGYDHNVIHQLALGTSLASIMVTSISSSRAHAKRGAVHFDILKNITPGILIGTFLGGLVATHLPVIFLRGFFVVFLFFVSAQMLSGYRPPATREMPGRLGTAGVGGVIAKAYVDYFEDETHRQVYRELLREVHIEQETADEGGRTLEGTTFVITGSVEHFANRSELKSLIESKGGKVTGSVTSKTSYLINNDAASTSSKNRKAKELGVPILTEEQFLQMLE